MPKAIRWFFKFISIIIALGLGVTAIILGAAVYLNSPPPHPAVLTDRPELSPAIMRIEDNVLYMEIRSGESAQSVGRRLHNAGIIRHRYFWNLLFRLDGEFIKTGTYRIELPASQTRIRSILVSGEQLLVRVTIPEGVTLRRAARILEDAGICGFDDFLAAASSREILDAFNIPGASMEGYLFPDTYLFPLGFPATMVVTAMANNFFNRLAEIEPEALSLSPAELNERVILASIVEREHRIPEEAAIMAGVFTNRLRIGMALQSCATIEYIITEILGQPHPTRIFYRDLEIRNPFNTYMFPGLPPGPISGPGETALRAAFNPARTDYLYFRLVDPSTGRHHFSRTLEEHIRAGALFVGRR